MDNTIFIYLMDYGRALIHGTSVNTKGIAQKEGFAFVFKIILSEQKCNVFTNGGWGKLNHIQMGQVN